MIIRFWGFLVAAFPYFVYLTLFKKNLAIKHYLIAIAAGLNSELVHAPFFIIFLFIFLFAFKFIDKKRLKNLFFYQLYFIFFVLISNVNILYAFLFDGPFHREEIELLGDKFNF